MTDKAIRNVALKEVASIRFFCTKKGCKSVVEIPLDGTVKELPYDFNCPVCKESFSVLDEIPNWPGGKTQTNVLPLLFRFLLKLQKDAIELVIPNREGAKP